MQLKSRSLKIALVDYVKNTFKISVLFDTFSDILDFFKYLFKYLKILFYFVSIRIFYWIVFTIYSWPKLACIIPSYGLYIAASTLYHLISYSSLST